MLEFWFDPDVSLGRKLTFLIAIVLVTAVLYQIQPLNLQAILLFMATGVIFLICRYCKQHFAFKQPGSLLYRLLTWIPIALLLALMFMQIKTGEILLPGAQGIGFMALTVCLLSPLALFRQTQAEKPQPPQPKP